MNVAKMKIADLKKELKERDLPTSGNKSELASRLKDALTAEGGEASPQEEDLEAKESELLGEEEEEEEDASDPVELDTKLLETSTTPVATPAAKHKKIVINREAAESAQQAAATAIAEAAKAAPPAAPTPVPITAPEAGDTPPAAKRIKLSGLSESERLAKRAEKLGSAPTEDNLSNLKILTSEERKAARLAKFSSAADTPATPTAAPADTPTAVPAQKNGADELEKLKKRAGRFGEAVSPKVITLEESERLKKRRERFGIVTPEDTKAKRAARFSSSGGATLDPATEDKKKLRSARFDQA